MKPITAAVALAALTFPNIYAQGSAVSAFKTTDLNWYNTDPNTTTVESAVDKTYLELLPGKKVQKTVM